MSRASGLKCGILRGKVFYNQNRKFGDHFIHIKLLFPIFRLN
uniref:Uncharacterized protein n=1 Tax=Arundo donax TaxID=35708 RepID=A0A0A9HJV4_ARUDO